MQSQQREQIKILSFLLQFPDAEMIDELSAFREQIEAAFEEAYQAHIRQITDYLLHTPALALQENYSAWFDLTPSTCLNLTYHRYGDDKRRGSELARFAAAYENCGFEPARSELPDYLPMVLELMAQDENGDCRWMIVEYRSALSKLSERVDRNENPYADLFKILMKMVEPLQERA